MWYVRRIGVEVVDLDKVVVFFGFFRSLSIFTSSNCMIYIRTTICGGGGVIHFVNTRVVYELYVRDYENCFLLNLDLDGYFFCCLRYTYLAVVVLPVPMVRWCSWSLDIVYGVSPVRIWVRPYPILSDFLIVFAPGRVSQSHSHSHCICLLSNEFFQD